MRDKNPNDPQIQYKWDHDGFIKNASTLVDINGDVNSAELAVNNAEMTMDMIQATSRDVFSGKELPHADTVGSIQLGLDEAREYFNNLFNATTSSSPAEYTGVTRDLVRIDDNLKTTSLGSIVGRKFVCNYGQQSAWLRCHYSLSDGSPNQYNNTAFADKYLTFNDQYHTEMNRHREDIRTHFPNTLTYNQAWYETMFSMYNTTGGHVDGLLDEFPKFVFRIRDEDDLQGPITRYIEMVITYFVDIEYVPIIMPKNHLKATTFQKAHQDNAEYKNGAEGYSLHAPYDIIIDRKYVMNKSPIIGFKNVSLQLNLAYPGGINQTLDALEKCSMGADWERMLNRTMPDEPETETTVTWGSRLNESNTAFNLSVFRPEAITTNVIN